MDIICHHKNEEYRSTWLKANTVCSWLETFEKLGLRGTCLDWGADEMLEAITTKPWKNMSSSEKQGLRKYFDNAFITGLNSKKIKRRAPNEVKYHLKGKETPGGEEEVEEPMYVSLFVFCFSHEGTLCVRRPWAGTLCVP